MNNDNYNAYTVWAYIAYIRLTTYYLFISSSQTINLPFEGDKSSNIVFC